ncbi:unnamed protein product [Ambrosiozyma monospora]|uniref:Unnamed protein product n=1 Tax=Ambrosiozyma monospora TaxID=43982 RepID=A0ACB5TR32_AMBMO|nr:unnamed protein product [Ambrosiozyma monospora]
MLNHHRGQVCVIWVTFGIPVILRLDLGYGGCVHLGVLSSCEIDLFSIHSYALVKSYAYMDFVMENVMHMNPRRIRIDNWQSSLNNHRFTPIASEISCFDLQNVVFISENLNLFKRLRCIEISVKEIFSLEAIRSLLECSYIKKIKISFLENLPFGYDEESVNLLEKFEYKIKCLPIREEFVTCSTLVEIGLGMHDSVCKLV